MIEGYQLHRLRHELSQALEDVGNKESSWQVLTGWKGETISLETEIWGVVEKTKMTDLIDSLLILVNGVSDSLRLVCSGD